ncbi:ribonuclease R [Antarcticirhabdus aurantiaca]|uniref:ribonuclease R n=1 Tax=Antarcticirhabdus aurantiaca TaxID=2606717 RepID=UPI00131C6E93|nr:ribonuclease R [Antarcticirhabdus aurantiaca]
MARKRGHETEARPELTREAVLRFIADNPSRATKRDIAKAFGVKGAERIDLKRLLGELAEEGLIEGTRKRFHQAGALPPVLVLEVRARDEDGGLIAEPPGWDEAERGPRPRLPVRQRRGEGPTVGVGDRFLARVAETEDGERVARVLRLVEKERSVELGVFRPDPNGGGRVEPVERRQSEYRVAAGDEKGAGDGDLVEVEPHGRSRFGLPTARVVEIVGSMKSERAISTIALHAHSIPHVFPPGVLHEAEAAGPVSDEDREDWRDLALITIDPADAKDHDDAVHARPDEDPSNPDGVVVTVAIADVSWYVRPGSKLDAEARLRGNSVYFPDRVVPMLPERISNDLCSLREGVDRPALAVRMIFDVRGDKRTHSFHRITMRSRAKLSYEAAQGAVDGNPTEVAPEILETVLKPLYEAYGKLAAARDRRQPLALDLPERKIRLKPDGSVDKVVVPARLESHRLIEEFMIQANVCAAETLEQKRQALIYRIHDSPSLAKLEALRDFLRTLEIPLASAGTLRPQHFNGILAFVREGEHESLVNEVVLRSQSQAVYTPENIGHFGLNLARYAHFTSPIRRYADLIVHRGLVTALGLGAGGLSREDEENLAQTAEEISRAERRAMAAERDTIDRLIAHHLADKVGAEFEGRITGVTKAGLFVVLPVYGADGFVPISTLGRQFFVYDEAGHALVGDRDGHGYRLGDTVEVKLVEALPLAGAMRFEMLTEPRELPRGSASFHKSRLRRPSRPGGRPKNVSATVRRRR